MIKIGPVYIVTICRVLLERLIVNRPHPWGLLITFIELIKNPTFKFWTHEFVHCAPEIQKLFESVARSCMVASQPRQETPGRVRKSWISASLGKPSFVKLKIYVPVFLFRCLYLFFLVYFLIKKKRILKGGFPYQHLFILQRWLISWFSDWERRHSCLTSRINWPWFCFWKMSHHTRIYFDVDRDYSMSELILCKRFPLKDIRAQLQWCDWSPHCDFQIPPVLRFIHKHFKVLCCPCLNPVKKDLDPILVPLTSSCEDRSIKTSVDCPMKCFNPASEFIL